MGKSRRRRDSSSSEEEYDADSNSSDASSDASDSDDSDESSDSSGGSDSSESDSGSDSDDSSASGDDSDEDYTQLLNVLAGAGLKSAGKKLITNKVYSVATARAIPVAKLVKKYKIKESEAKSMKKLLNDPAALLPPDSSDSEGSVSTDKSADEDEVVWRLLRSIDEGNLIKVFKKHKMTDLKKVYKLTDKKLKRMGIPNKEIREKILREIEKKKDNKTSSEEDEEIKIAKILKAIDMKAYVKNLQKGKVTDLYAAYQLTSSNLKALGIASKRDRSKIMKAIAKYKATHAEDPEFMQLRRVLTKIGLRKYLAKFKKQDVDSIRKLKKIDHKALRDMGVATYRERKEIIEKVEKIGNNGEVEKEEVSDSEGSGAEEGDAVVNDILRSQYMSRHIADFKRAKIFDLKEARKLTHTQLRAMGVALYLDREKLIDAFKEYRPKNKLIMKILADNNLSKHCGEFEKLVDVEEARGLTHADLRAMGISLYGQRDRLIRAFASHEGDEDEDETSSKRSKKKKKKRS